MIYIRYVFLVLAIILMVSCDQKKTQESIYQPKYSEEQLVGEWVRNHSYVSERFKYGDFDQDVLLQDTFVFKPFNDVVYKSKTTYNYTHRKDEKWGTYEFVRGTYHLVNDTLIVSLDYPNICREEFGRDPFGSVFGSQHTIYLYGNDSIGSMYSVMDLSTERIEICCIKRWEGKTVTQDYSRSEPSPICYYHR